MGNSVGVLLSTGFAASVAGAEDSAGSLEGPDVPLAASASALGVEASTSAGFAGGAAMLLVAALVRLDSPTGVVVSVPEGFELSKRFGSVGLLFEGPDMMKRK